MCIYSPGWGNIASRYRMEEKVGATTWIPQKRLKTFHTWRAIASFSSQLGSPNIARQPARKVCETRLKYSHQTEPMAASTGRHAGPSGGLARFCGANCRSSCTCRAMWWSCGDLLDRLLVLHGPRHFAGPHLRVPHPSWQIGFTCLKILCPSPFFASVSFERNTEIFLLCPSVWSFLDLGGVYGGQHPSINCRVAQSLHLFCPSGIDVV